MLREQRSDSDPDAILHPLFPVSCCEVSNKTNKDDASGRNVAFS